MSKIAKNLIIGTAGHIDHGKTTLIEALTGVDTDRLDEEKERGISIDLGFSKLDLESEPELELGVVDVPGHEKFVKNMLAGAGGVDIALLVVAADEGIMEQTKEHLAILDLLEIEAGLVVVTKSDKVDDEWLELVMLELEEELEDTFLSSAEIVPASAVENRGLEQVKAKLATLAKEIESNQAEEISYLPVDRAFSLPGAGTIVTGTLVSGEIAVGDKLQLYPKPKEVEVRGLQAHEQDLKQTQASQRVGVNLTGIDTAEIERGDVLAPVDAFRPTRVLDLRFKFLDSADFILEHGTRIRFHIGAREVLGRIYLLDCKELMPGQEALAQLKLEEEVIARYGENYVIRRYSPVSTIGGGKIIEPLSYKKKRLEKETIAELERKESSDDLERLAYLLELESKQALQIEELVLRTSLSKARLIPLLNKLETDDKVVALNKGQNFLHSKNYQDLVAEIKGLLADYHHSYPLREGMPREELRNKLSFALESASFQDLLESLAAKDIQLAGAEVALIDFEIEFPAELAEIKAEIVSDYQQQRFTPPKTEEVIAKYSGDDYNIVATTVEEIIAYLEREEILVKLAENLYFHQQAIKAAKEKLIEVLKEQQEVTTGEYRDLLASTRKYTIPVLEYFDSQGLTRREDNKRVLR